MKDTKDLSKKQLTCDDCGCKSSDVDIVTDPHSTNTISLCDMCWKERVTAEPEEISDREYEWNTMSHMNETEDKEQDRNLFSRDD